MIMAATIFLGMTGMASLSMAMEKHHEQIWGNTRLTVQRAWAMRAAGWLLLLAAAALAVRMQGATMGLTLWVMEVSLASVCVGLLLSYAPRLLPWLAVGGLLAAWLAA